MVTVMNIDRISRQRSEILTIAASANLVEAANKMTENEVGSLLALNDSGKIIGIVTEHDIVVKVVAAGLAPKDFIVDAIMTKTVISCAPSIASEEAQRIMAVHGIRHLPIVEDGIPVGMVSSRDILAQQLSAMRAMVQKQSRILQVLEYEHPGITTLQKDRAGRVVI